MAQLVAACHGIASNACAAETFCFFGLGAASAILLRGGFGLGAAHIEDSCAEGGDTCCDWDCERTLLAGAENLLNHCDVLVVLSDVLITSRGRDRINWQLLLDKNEF
jgi:hypothetical protein